MTTKIKHLRAEVHRHIGEIIERDAGTIIAIWAERARDEQPTASRVHHDVLLDHMPKFLAEVGRTLASAGDDGVEPKREAVEHGGQRWESGWSITEVVRDYQILRIVLVEFLEKSLARRLQQREALVLNVTIDDAIAASVAAFVASQSAPGSAAMATGKDSMDLLLNVLGVVGHELRNPLAPLMNSLEILRLGGADSAQLEEIRQMMERQVRVLGRLVDDMMDLPRLARGKMSIRRERLDLVPLLKACIEDRRGSLEAAGISLNFLPPPESAWITGDATRLTQVFGNLVGNAQKFTDRGGTVSVRLEIVGGAKAFITIRDTGIGIERGLLSRVFEAYIQADRSLDRSRGGLGLGLALVKGVVQLHGGSVAAASDGPGKGATFTVELPLADAEESSLAPGVSASNVPATAQRVLVIEDNRDSAESLRMYLELQGHKVGIALNGSDGIKLAAELLPEVVICDVGLPGMDGYAVAAELRRLVTPPPRLIIAVTGHRARIGPEDEADKVFDYYLVKPIAPERIARLMTTPTE